MIRKLLQILLLTLTLTLTLSPVFAAGISTVDSSGGAYSSVKLQSNGKPAIAYFDYKTGELRYSYCCHGQRACRRNAKYGGGSITALPIIETQAGDVSAYIPTNVISITDGQIFLETDLFYKGVRPAVNVGLSVSRVGSSAQIKAMKKVSGTLKLDLAQFRELEAFSQFGSDLDEGTKKQLERGKRAVEVLKQPQYAPVKAEHQVVTLYALVKGFMDDVPVAKIKEFEAGLIDYTESNAKVFFKDIRETKMWSDAGEAEIKKVIGEFKGSFKL